MATVVQCPHCSKKLKMRAVPAGKKVRCPACKEAFVPQSAAAARPKARPKKKAKPVADDYVDFGDEGLYEDGDLYDDGLDDGYDEPAPARRSGGKRGSQAGGKTKGRKSSKSSKSSKSKGGNSKSKMPLIIGIVALIVVGIGAGIFFAMSGGEDGTDVVDTDPTAADPTAMADPAAQAIAAPGAENFTSQDVNPATTTAVANNTAVSDPTATTTTTSDTSPTPSAAGVLDPTYLPVDSELFAVVDVDRLLSGPLGTMLPMVGPQIQQMKQAVGLGPEDISTVTLGVAGISGAASANRPPQPTDVPAILVVRAKKSIDPAQLQAAIPNAGQVTQGDISYIRIPENPPAAIWLADSTTAVIGVEEIVVQTATSGSSASSFDPALMDQDTAIRLAFQPTNPDAVFRQGPLPPAPPMPGVAEAMSLVKAVQPGITAAGFGIDLGQDVKVFGAIRSKDEQAAAAAKAALQKFVEDARKLAEQQMPGMQTAGGTDSLDNLQITNNGNMTQFSAVQKDGGQQLVMMAPMIAMSVQNAQQGARQAAQRVQGQNKLKQIALALHNFHSAWGRFPNAIPRDDSGKPLLSWRVHVLEFLGPNEAALYQKFNLNEPWDSPTNRPLLEQMPALYQADAAELAPGKTRIQLPVGPGTIFEGGQGRGMREIIDGSTNTILMVEAAPEHAVNWTEPDELDFDPQNPVNGLSSPAGFFRAVTADGAVARISLNLSPDALRALFTRAGGDYVPPDAVQSGAAAPMSAGGPLGPSPGGAGGNEPQIVGTTSNGIPMTTKDWRDAQGNVLFTAQLVDFKDGNVHLKRADSGEVVVKPLDELHESDQDMIRFFADE